MPGHQIEADYATEIHTANIPTFKSHQDALIEQSAKCRLDVFASYS